MFKFLTTGLTQVDNSPGPLVTITTATDFFSLQSIQKKFDADGET